MAHLTSLRFPLALILSLLLVVIASAEYDAPNYNSQHPDQYQQHDQLLDADNQQHYGNAAGQLGSTPNLGGADHLLGNLFGDKQNRNGQEEHQGQENFVPSYTSAYENNKAYYDHEHKTYDQVPYPNIDFIGILGFVLCESEANKYDALKGKF